MGPVSSEFCERQHVQVATQVLFLLLLPQAKVLLKLSGTKKGADIKAAATIKEYAQEADKKEAGLDATGHVIQR